MCTFSRTRPKQTWHWFLLNISPPNLHTWISFFLRTQHQGSWEPDSHCKCYGLYAHDRSIGSICKIITMALNHLSHGSVTHMFSLRSSSLMHDMFLNQLQTYKRDSNEKLNWLPGAKFLPAARSPLAQYIWKFSRSRIRKSCDIVFMSPKWGWAAIPSTAYRQKWRCICKKQIDFFLVSHNLLNQGYTLVLRDHWVYLLASIIRFNHYVRNMHRIPWSQGKHQCMYWQERLREYPKRWST